MQYGALVYNVFCASVLYFLTQLEVVPDAVHDQEESAIPLLASGPTEWANASDLWRMGEQCGVGRSFHCVKARGEAAMLRAYHFEAWENPVDDEARKLQSWRGASEWDERVIFWAGWYDRSFPQTLVRNKEAMARRGITLHGIKQKLCAGTGPVQDRKSLRAGLQKAAADSNLWRFFDVWERRVDHKLRRWELQGNRHRHCDRLIVHLRSLGRLVAPRVAAAVWGLGWNRLCTARRYQSTAPCVLGCGADQTASSITSGVLPAGRLAGGCCN